ncbi:MAG: hypothetical protein CVV27_04020, partial [Candidatus Melainabacteria bacterium HGW-Melainabacteria-1]
RLKAAIQTGPVPYFRDYLPRMLEPGLGRQGARTVASAIQASAGRQLIQRFPRHLREHLTGLAEGAGIPLRDVMQAFVLPDLFLWLVSLSNRKRQPGPAPLLPTSFLPTLGCSSALAMPGATADGALLRGRNLDYMGVGYWDAEPAILFYQPDGAMPYVSVSAAGVPFGGFTSMNAAGLTLAVHQHLSSLNVRRGGTPIGIAGDAVMRQAETLADAVRLLDAQPPTACWTYLIASAREQALLVYETTGQGSKWFISQAPVYGYTNFFHDRSLAARETHLYPSQWRSNLGRYRTICTELSAKQGSLTPDHIAGILGHGGGNCRLAKPLAMLYTISSAVFVPAKGLVYAASGPAPVSQRPYWAFDLNLKAARPDLAPLQGGVAEPAADEAFACYRQAYTSWFGHADSGRALQWLEKACQLMPREPLYAYMAGLSALDSRQPDQTVHWLNKALELGHLDPERVASFYLWRGRAYDCAGMRAQARQDYLAAEASNPDLTTARSAIIGRDRPWRWRRLALEFNYAEAL